MCSISARKHNGSSDAEEETRQSKEDESRVSAYICNISLLSFLLHCFKFEIRFVFCHRKSKKEGKHESKADKESDIEKAKANAALWELRVQVTDQSLVQYREACRKLARANEELSNQLYRAEKDTIDITGFLKRQDAAKEEKVRGVGPIVNTMNDGRLLTICLLI